MASRPDKPTILIVDDSPDFRLLLSRYCKREGYEAESIVSGDSLFSQGHDVEQYCAVLLDIMMPGMDGFETLRRIRQATSKVPVIMTTALDDPDTVVKCLKLGAFDFISKPIDQARLSSALRNAVGNFALRQEVDELSRKVAETSGFRKLVGHSAHLRKLELHLSRLARQRAPDILIVGPEGCGRQAAARSFHRLREDGRLPFASLNFAFIPEHHHRDELFNGKSNAVVPGEGKGTLCLQAIEHLNPELQRELAYALTAKKRDHALIVTSKSSLTRKGMVDESLGKLIEGASFRILPLKERREDIPPLAEHFLSLATARSGKNVTAIDPLAMEALEVYDWPANVRQLKQVIERAVVLCSGSVIELDNLPREIVPAHLADLAERRSESAGIVPKLTTVLSRLEQNELAGTRYVEVEEPKTITGHIIFEEREDIIPLARIERAAITSALNACNGDIQDTARRLEVSRATIYRRLRRYGIDPDENRL